MLNLFIENVIYITKQSHFYVLYIMSKQPSELSLVKYKPMSTMLLHSIAPNVTHTNWDD